MQAEPSAKTGTIVVTGGAGFIGSHFVRLAMTRTAARIVVLDKLTYAGNMLNLAGVASSPRFAFVHADIADRTAVVAIYRDYHPTWVINFAAESHVDRSIDRPQAFVDTNVVGTVILLDAARGYLAECNLAQRAEFRFLQVSTDEVYGSLGATGLFSETTLYAPNSPYAASKASADHFARAYQETFGVPVLITNSSNNYGPYQFPEKLIPLTILNAVEGRPLPVYGDGKNVRDWLYVEDHCEALLEVIERGRPGEKYNIGAQNERANIEIVGRICAVLETLLPAADNPALRARGVSSYAALQTFVSDRPGHDRRYALDASKIRTELHWRPRHDFDTGLAQTVRWYLDNRQWCEAVQAGGYHRERLGLALGAQGRSTPSQVANS
jgi:dTDP-glucose 4,6-dehydratase